MTSGEPPAGPSASTLGGYTLIGAGALAAVLGVITMMSGGSEDVAQQPPPGSVPTSSVVSDPPQQPPPSPPAESNSSPARPPGDAGKPSPGAPQPPQSSNAPQVPRPGGAGQPGTPQRPGDGNDGSVRPGSDQARLKIVVRVYNNSTIPGLAQRAAEDFRRVGYEVPEVGNYSAGRIYTTTVYYRPGTEEQAQAGQVAAHFGARLEPRFDGIAHSSPGVIAIITNDYKGPASPK